MVDETSGYEPKSPYAASKMMVEMVLADAAAAQSIRVVSLRYFNPVGADPQLRSGLQDPAPSHALGQLISAHAAGQAFTITGVDWPTRDGSAIRDYVHVWDLAQAHVAAIRRFDDICDLSHAFDVINLGTGMGTTVRELVAAFRDVVGQEVQVVEAERRPGDVVGSYTSTEKAKHALAWSARKTVEDGIRDSVQWAERRAGILGA